MLLLLLLLLLLRGGGSQKSDSVGGFRTPPPFKNILWGVLRLFFDASNKGTTDNAGVM